MLVKHPNIVVNKLNINEQTEKLLDWNLLHWQKDHKLLLQGMPKLSQNQQWFLGWLMLQTPLGQWLTISHWQRCSANSNYNGAWKFGCTSHHSQFNAVRVYIFQIFKLLFQILNISNQKSNAFYFNCQPGYGDVQAWPISDQAWRLKLEVILFRLGAGAKQARQQDEFKLIRIACLIVLPEPSLQASLNYTWGISTFAH